MGTTQARRHRCVDGNDYRNRSNRLKASKLIADRIEAIVPEDIPISKHFRPQSDIKVWRNRYDGIYPADHYPVSVKLEILMESQSGFSSSSQMEHMIASIGLPGRTSGKGLLYDLSTRFMGLIVLAMGFRFGLDGLKSPFGIG